MTRDAMPPGTVERNTAALIELVDKAAAQRRSEVLDAANASARGLLQAARREARLRVHAAFEDARRQARGRIAAAHATLETRRRLAAHRRTMAMLAACWEALPDAFVARWREPASRAAWVARAVSDARGALPPGAWRIVYAQGWPADERESVRESIARPAHGPPELVEDASLGAGLRISAQNATVDATVTGLLADRREIGASLLQRLEAACAPARERSP